MKNTRNKQRSLMLLQVHTTQRIPADQAFPSHYFTYINYFSPFQPRFTMKTTTLSTEHQSTGASTTVRQRTFNSASLRYQSLPAPSKAAQPSAGTRALDCFCTQKASSRGWLAAAARTRRRFRRYLTASRTGSGRHWQHHLRPTSEWKKVKMLHLTLAIQI
jgi:hypothetical protein